MRTLAYLAMIAWLQLVVFPVIALEELVDECRRRRERRRP